MSKFEQKKHLIIALCELSDDLESQIEYKERAADELKEQLANYEKENQEVDAWNAGKLRETEKEIEGIKIILQHLEKLL